ncbi:amidase [Spiractinospora alimapuensis]|nr:amidase [Spiractinospora alimapuensis]QVQ55131.1 amidase [Spiractinospora alimapuensis]
MTDRTARELVAMLRSREVSAREVVQAHLERIEAVNPAVNAVVTNDGERALERAAEADDRLAAGEPVGPLHGVPVAHKDTHDTAGVRTTYGSPIYSEHVPDQDSLVVERMREAGAISLGKTNTPEFAAGSHTFNPVFGTTVNPYDTSKSAGGSSGGAAAGLATGMFALADGSDMGGSLRNPAAFNNVVGLRSTPGRVPVWPNGLGWATLSVQGPMGRTVDDTALLLSVIAGPDSRSPIAVTEDPAPFAALGPTDLSGMRFAWSEDLGGLFSSERAVLDTLRPQLDVVRALGGEVEEAHPDLTGADEAFRTLRAWIFASEYGPILDRHPEQVKSSVIWNIEMGRDLTGEDVARAERLHTEVFHRMREFFERYDALLLPVSQVTPFNADEEYPADIDGVVQETYLDWMRSCYLISLTGCPALSVPGGFSPSGLPVGLQIVGPHLGEADVLRVGAAIEGATGTHRVRPTLP